MLSLKVHCLPYVSLYLLCWPDNLFVTTYFKQNSSILYELEQEVCFRYYKQFLCPHWNCLTHSFSLSLSLCVSLCNICLSSLSQWGFFCTCWPRTQNHASRSKSLRWPNEIVAVNATSASAGGSSNFGNASVGTFIHVCVSLGIWVKWRYWERYSL